MYSMIHVYNNILIDLSIH